MGRQLATFGDISYTYNEEGIRTSKTSNGVTTKFLLDGYNVIEQSDGTTTLHFFYDSNGEVIGFRYDGNDYFYVKNARSDIIAITDSNKNIVAEYRYDPWGDILSTSGDTVIGSLNPFRYRSYYYDVETGFYYLQSRYYDPEVGRFINCDDVNYIGINDTVVSYNPFAYCENDPVNMFDRFGTRAINITKKLTDKMRNSAEIMKEIMVLYEKCYSKAKAKYYSIEFFVNCVKTGGMWDLKSLPDWQLNPGEYFVFCGKKLRYDDPGNIHFGYVGSVLFGERTLRMGAGLYQIKSGISSYKYIASYFDDPQDSKMISLGCALYKLDATLLLLIMLSSLKNKYI